MNISTTLTNKTTFFDDYLNANIYNLLDKTFIIPPTCEYKIFVVDNASTDNSIEQLQDECPQVEVIKNDSNYGFAQANNIGMEVALKQGFDYFLIINIYCLYFF